MPPSAFGGLKGGIMLTFYCEAIAVLLKAYGK